MEALNEFIQWFWRLETDGLITTWVKANVIIVSVVGVLVRHFVKRTPSTDDDMLLDDLRRVLPLMKRKR